MKVCATPPDKQSRPGKILAGDEEIQKGNKGG